MKVEERIKEIEEFWGPSCKDCDHLDDMNLLRVIPFLLKLVKRYRTTIKECKENYTKHGYIKRITAMALAHDPEKESGDE